MGIDVSTNGNRNIFFPFSYFIKSIFDDWSAIICSTETLVIHNISSSWYVPYLFNAVMMTLSIEHIWECSCGIHQYFFRLQSDNSWKFIMLTVLTCYCVQCYGEQNREKFTVWLVQWVLCSTTKLWRTCLYRHAKVFLCLQGWACVQSKR